MAVQRPRPGVRSSSRLFENYEIQRLLGTGTFGAVFDCMNKFEKRNYAVKVMKFGTEGADREIQNLVKIPPHPNLVQYFTCWKDSFGAEDVAVVRKRFGDQDFGENFIVPSGLASFDAFCILMELCGQDLREWLCFREGTDLSSVNEVAAIQIFRQISRGVEHLHRHGLIHRDLKPENIFLAKGDTTTSVKIGDLGIATSSANARHTTGIGTRAYLAPEQEGNSYGPAVDVFALGIIFLELLFPPMQPDFDEEEAEDGKPGNHTKVVIGLKYLHSVPEEVFRLWPISADLILQMVNILAGERPGFPQIYEALDRASGVSSIVRVDDVVEQQEDDILNTNLTLPPKEPASTPSSGYNSENRDDNVHPPQQEADQQPHPTVHTAESSQHLETLLSSSSPGDTIHLHPSQEYSGDFVILTQNLTLNGNGALLCGTRTSLTIQGSKCIVRNLALKTGTEAGLFIRGDENVIDGVTLTKFDSSATPGVGISLHGSSNSVQNSSIINSSKGIVSTGDSTTFSSLTLSHCSQAAMVLIGSGCSVQNVECSNSPNGLWIGGDDNRILGLDYKFTEEFSLQHYNFGQTGSGQAVTIGRGRNNFVSNFRNFARPSEFRNGLLASMLTSGLRVVDSSVGRMFLEGEGHALENCSVAHGATLLGGGGTMNKVNFGCRLEVQGRGHRLLKCSAGHFIRRSGFCEVEVVRCNFA